MSARDWNWYSVSQIIFPYRGSETGPSLTGLVLFQTFVYRRRKTKIKMVTNHPVQWMWVLPYQTDSSSWHKSLQRSVQLQNLAKPASYELFS